MNESLPEFALLFGKITIILAVATTAYLALRRTNPRWQVLTCRVSVCALLICCCLAMTSMSDAWGPTLTVSTIPQPNAVPLPASCLPLRREKDTGAQELDQCEKPSQTTSQQPEPGNPAHEQQPKEQRGNNFGEALVATIAPSDDLPRQQRPYWSAVPKVVHGTTAKQASRTELKDTTASAGSQQASNLAKRGWTMRVLPARPIVGTSHAWTWVCLAALIVWATVATFLFALRLLAIYQIQQMVRRSSPVPSEFNAACSAISLQPRLSDDVGSPTVVGCWRPVILLPTWMVDGTFAQENMRAACAHEQAHVANADLVWIQIFEWLSIGLWLHPLLHVLKAFHRSACERVADSDAATCMGDARAYATSLARVALQVLARPTTNANYLAMVAPRRGSSAIAQRLQWVRTATPARRLGHCRIGLAIGFFALAIVLGTFGISQAPLAAAMQEPKAGIDATRPVVPSDTVASSEPVAAGEPVAASRYNDPAQTPPIESTASSAVAQVAAKPMIAVAGPRQPVQDPSHPAFGEQAAVTLQAALRPQAMTTVFDAIVDAPLAVPLEDEPTCMVSASGIVRDEAGRPVPGVHVALVASLYRMSPAMQPLNPVVARTLTDAQGAFAFQDVVSVADQGFVVFQQDGRWWRIVAVSADGRVGWANVNSDALPASLAQDVVLSGTTAVAGQVVDEHAQPIAGATVQANYWARGEEYENGGSMGLSTHEHGVYLNDVPLKVETDANGHFKLEGLPVGSAVIATIRHSQIADKLVWFATTDDLLESGRMWGLHPGRSELRRSGTVITCEAGILIRGQVVDESGQGVDASVALYGAGSAATETKNGAYSLRVSPSKDHVRFRKATTGGPISYTIIVRPQDAKSYTSLSAKSVDGELEANSTLNFVLRKRRAFSGRVLTSDGQGVPGVGVLARAQHEAIVPVESHWKTGVPQAMEKATTDAQGNFTLNLPEGQIELLLSGRIPGLDLWQFNARDCDEMGQLWRWPSHAQPTMTLKAKPDRSQLNTLTLTRTAPVNVRVIDPAGQPIAGASVSMQAATGVTGSKKLTTNANELVPIADPVTTDADGRCRLMPFALPDYTAQIKVLSKQPGRPMIAKYVLEPILNVEETLRKGVVIQAAPARHIHGRVTVEGEPLANIWLNVGQLQTRLVKQVAASGSQTHVPQTYQMGSLPAHVRTDAQGRYEAFVDAAQTNWGVSLNAGFPNDHRSFPALPAQFSDGSQTRVDIDLKRGTHTLKGRVVDQQGQPVALSRVTIVGTQDFDPTAMYEATIVTTDFAGRFSFIGLPAGSYELYAVSGRDPQSKKFVRSETVTATTGAAATITLPVAP